MRLSSNPLLWVEVEKNKVKRLFEDRSQIVLFDSNGEEVILDAEYVKRTNSRNVTTYSNGSWFERGKFLLYLNK